MEQKFAEFELSTYMEEAYFTLSGCIFRRQCIRLRCFHIKIGHKNWDALEMKQSLTWRERMCVKHALHSFAHFLKGTYVKWYTDNRGVVSIEKSDSNKIHLRSWQWTFFDFLGNIRSLSILNGFRAARTNSLNTM